VGVAVFNAQQFAARLAARNEGAENRWSLLTDFVAEWHAPLQVGDGYSKEELDAAERRLGFALPVALREWYGLAGRREYIVARQNFLVSPDNLKISKENDLLIFYSVNQVVEWGIQPSDLSMADPPVWLDDSGMHEDPQKPIRENDTLSEFVLQMIVLETVWFTEPHGTAEFSDETVSILARHFQPLGLPDWHWPGRPTCLWGRNDVLVELFYEEGRQTEIGVSARSQASLGEALKLLG